MNLALFLTEENKSSIKGFAAQLAKKQEHDNIGGCALIFDDTIPEKEAIEILKVIENQFESLLPVACAVTKNAVSAMVWCWYAEILNYYPNPWMLVDFGYSIRNKNPLSKLDNILEIEQDQGPYLAGRAYKPSSDSYVVPGPLIYNAGNAWDKYGKRPTNADWRLCISGSIKGTDVHWFNVPEEAWPFGDKLDTFKKAKKPKLKKDKEPHEQSYQELEKAYRKKFKTDPPALSTADTLKKHLHSNS